MSGEDARIPAHIWIEAEIRRLSAKGIGVYVIARGDAGGGMVLQKISDLSGQCRLLSQQRDIEGRLLWADVLGAPVVAEADADAYIRRARERDPDLWVVEIEDRSLSERLNAASC